MTLSLALLLVEDVSRNLYLALTIYQNPCQARKDIAMKTETCFIVKNTSDVLALFPLLFFVCLVCF